MNRILKCLTGVILGIAIMATLPMSKVYAYSEVDCFDFGESTVSIAAGSQKTIWFRTLYDYTYYIEGATSDATYLECSFSSGSQYITFHIGDDEQGKNVFFHFYVVDDRLATMDKHDCVEVYVQNIKSTVANLPVTLAGGKSGTLTQNGKVSVLNNADGVAMASFSLSGGEGKMVSYGQQGVVNNGSNYFAVVTGIKYAAPKISESDKAVMLANGYAGVCIDGKYVNWP